MAIQTSEMSAELSCHNCGYDLRAHPANGRCPECGASVEESRRLKAIPRRPRWNECDPRWRRRMLAGIWILALMPVMHALTWFGWGSIVPVPTLFDYRGTVRTLDETLACDLTVYQPLLFCMGVVLLFSRERDRRRSRLVWTRRWGVLCSYVVLLLSAAEVLALAALVLAGVAAVFLSMPLKHQPQTAQFFVELSTRYLRYGPYPKQITIVVLVAFASIVILLACSPLFDALRSSASTHRAVVLLAPLALFSLMNLVQVCRYFLAGSGLTMMDVGFLGLYFRPELLTGYITGSPTYLFAPSLPFSAFAVEATKWCIVFGIAIWLSIAQITARRAFGARRRRAVASNRSILGNSRDGHSRSGRKCARLCHKTREAERGLTLRAIDG